MQDHIELSVAQTPTSSSEVRAKVSVIIIDTATVQQNDRNCTDFIKLDPNEGLSTANVS